MPPPLKPVVSFGEILLRYSPVGGGLRASDAFAIHVAGAEANVAIGLASLGCPARMASVLPDNVLGDRAADTLAAHGVCAAGCVRAPGRMGTFYLESPRNGREGGFFYDRTHSAFATAGAASIDWDRVLVDAAWLHVSGITVALGPGPIGQLRGAVAAAQRRGVPISFDCNYRPVLWQGREHEAPGLLREFASAAPLVFASEMDERLLIGDSETAGGLFACFDAVEIVASTRRCDTGGSPCLGARIQTRRQDYLVDPVPIEPFVDRIGAGDAFAAGVLFGLGNGWDMARVARFAHRSCLMKHGVAGDFASFRAAEVIAALG
ncbi:MAG: sugar kinase [Pseudomonadota bacterium]